MTHHTPVSSMLRGARPIALPLLAWAACSSAAAQVVTSAVCSYSRFSQPQCWSTGTAPINGPGVSYEIRDLAGLFTVEVDLPAEVSAIDAPDYRFVILQPFDASGPVHALSARISTGASARLGKSGNATTISSIDLEPGSSLQIDASQITFNFLDLDSNSESGGSNVTFNSPVLSSGGSIRVRSYGDGPNTLNLPFTQAISVAPGKRITLEGYVNAPMIQQIPDGILMLDNDPTSLLNVPLLQSVGELAITVRDDLAPIAIQSPPFVVVGPVGVAISSTRIDPIMFDFIASAGNMTFEDPVTFPVSAANLQTVGFLDIGHLNSSFSAPNLITFKGGTIDGDGASVFLPLADVTADAGPIQIARAGTFTEMNLQSLTRLPAESTLKVPAGATADLSSLQYIDDSSFEIYGTLASPMPPILSADRSYLRVEGPTTLVVLDDTIEFDSYQDARLGGRFEFPNAATIDTTSNPIQIGHAASADIIALDGQVSYPVLERVVNNAGQVAGLYLTAQGSGAQIDMPQLVELDRLEISASAWGGLGLNGLAQVKLERLDAPRINSYRSFRGRLWMPAQTRLDSDDFVYAFDLQMPGVTEANDTSIGATTANLTALTELTSSTVELDADGPTPFDLALAPGATVRDSKLITSGFGTIHAALIDQDSRLTIESGAALVTGDVETDDLWTTGVLQIAGNFTPPPLLALRPISIQMLGEGERHFRDTSGDAGPEATPSSRPPVTLTVGSETTTTDLHFAPPNSTSSTGAVYLQGAIGSAPGLTIHSGSTLYLDNVPTYILLIDELTGEPKFRPIQTLSPGGVRCFDFDEGTICLSSCVTDMNGDGVIDFGDIQSFVPLFLSQNPSADFNGDGIVDFGDIESFIAAFLAGC